MKVEDELERRSGKDRRSGKERRRGGPFGLPEHPTWKMITALLGAIFLIIVAGGAVLTSMRTEIDDLSDAVNRGGKVLSVLEDTTTDARDNTEGARERSFANRAGICTTQVIDNDRFFDLGASCLAPQIAAYYSTQVCARFFPSMPECGTKFNDPAL